MGQKYNAIEWYHIVDILDELGLMQQSIEKRMVLVASMGNELRPDQTTYVAYEELTDLICHEMKVIDHIGSWPKHLRECLERYELSFFFNEQSCALFYYNYFATYMQVQKLMMKETERKLL